MDIKALKQVSTVLVCIAGCAPADDSSIEVTTPNELGVTMLAVDHFTDGDARVFELRGLDAAGQQQALVRLRTGTIADAAQWFPAGTPDDFGSEIITSIGGNDARYVTRETELFVLEAEEPTSQRFLALASATLEREAHILVPPVAADGDTPYITGACRSFDLLTSPVADQCCYAFAPAPSLIGGGTKFYNASLNKVVTRKINKYGYGCRASDGVSACAGINCYFGPLGFARPVMASPPAYPYWRIQSLYQPDMCSAVGYQTPVSPVFGAMTGSYATGLGCPGGNDGKFSWDY